MDEPNETKPPMDDKNGQVVPDIEAPDLEAPDDDGVTAAETFGGLPLPWRALHLLVLTTFAIAQPLFVVLGEGPAFFVAHDSSTADILILALGVAFVPALILFGVEGLVHLVNRKAAWRVHLGFVGVLAALILTPVMDRLGIDGGLVLVLSVAAGAGFAVLYNRLKPMRSFVSILGVAPLAFIGMFLFGTDVSKIAFPTAVAASDPIQVGGDSPVVILVFDEFPAQTLMTGDLEIDAELFPNFARLGDMSTWYRNAGTVDERTTQSVPSILTGQRTQDEEALPVFQEHPQNIFTMLGDEYTVRSWEPVTALCPTSLCTGDKPDPLGERLDRLVSDTYAVYLNIVVPEDLRDRLPDVTRTWGNFAGGGLLPPGEDSGGDTDDASTQVELGNVATESQREDRGGRLEEIVAGINGEASTLYTVHSIVPHMPWIYFPSGRSYGPAPIHGLNGSSWGDEEWAAAQNIQRHLLQTMYIDKIVGSLLDRLEAEGTLDESFIAIAADHGISFIPGAPPRFATDDNYWDILNVPFFIKLPFQTEGAISDANVDTIDIVPTIADALDVDVPWEFDGRSLLDDDHRSGKDLGRPGQEPLQVPGSRPASLALLDAKVRLLGPNHTLADVYAIGPHSDIVGQPVGSFIFREPSGLEARLTDFDAIAAYDPSQLNIPAWLEGEIVGISDGSSAIDLAFVVDGTIEAVAHTLGCCDAEFPFSVVLSEQLFESGGPKVEVFRVHESAGVIELEPMLTRTFALD
jgi:hypothetical protein